MTVQDFLARLRKLNDLIECMPATSLGPPEVLAPKFDSEELLKGFLAPCLGSQMSSVQQLAAPNFFLSFCARWTLNSLA